jgi:FtsP/CotA-like multicopper oxidase with cupredoxin domain
MSDWTRRRLVGRGALGAAIAAVSGKLFHDQQLNGAYAAGSKHPSQSGTHPLRAAGAEHGKAHDGAMTVGTTGDLPIGVDPHAYLSLFDYGKTSKMEDGRTLREWIITAVDREIEIAPGVFFPAWAYNGQVPGPTLRCIEGERLRITFINAGSHPHTMHFHGIHGASMDGVPGAGDGMINTGERTFYEFDAKPFGVHLYHCHATPLKRHIHKGLYGAFIVDPDPANYTGVEREIARSRNHLEARNKDVNEMVMVMNGFDTNFDGDNEVYAANSVAFAYMHKPIKIRPDQLQRIYLINITEFDPINSFHLHANFFHYYDHGTTLQPTLRTVDTIMQCQAQRGLLEFSFEGFEPGKYMFHAHQSEFAELGWMGFFELVDGEEDED